MSTFGGRIPELPYVSVDRFDGDNDRASAAFFLSHCHTDHMVGLADLQRPEEDVPAEQDETSGEDLRPLYLTAVSAVIVRGLFPRLRLNLLPLSVGEPTLISYTYPPDVRQYVTVTALPSGHCPGSAMFLFEVETTGASKSSVEQRILYTGDFRLTARHLAHMAPFRRQPPPIIHCAHIDSTFLAARYAHFPTQRRSTQCVADLCADWLNAHPANHVRLLLPARFGYEYLLPGLAQRLRQPVHITDSERARMYRHCAELDGSWTAGEHASTTTRIHACTSVSSAGRCAARLKDPAIRSIPCRLGDAAVPARHVRTILLSAMAWTHWRTTGDADSSPVHREVQSQVFRVCYSTHSSCTEIAGMLRLLRPQRVELNVLPAGRVERERMQELVAIIMAEYAASDGVAEEDTKRTKTAAPIAEQFDLSGIEFRPAAAVVNVADEDSDEGAGRAEVVPQLPKRRRHAECQPGQPS